MIRILPRISDLFALPGRDITAKRAGLDPMAIIRQRRALDRLEPHHLRDIGLTAPEARREAQRPFWDAPDNWRQ